MTKWYEVAFGIVVGGVLLYFVLVFLNFAMIYYILSPEKFIVGILRLILFFLRGFFPYLVFLIGFVVISYIFEYKYLRKQN